jgi:hypothetical protein
VIYKTVQTPTLTIGGVAAQVLFSGVASGDDVPIVLAFGATSDTATIAVK